MCGRYTLRTPPSQWLQHFLPDWDEELPSSLQQPRYNIAPTQNVACVLQTKVGLPRELQMLRWGLVPSWAKELSIGSRMINARSETVAEKPSFRKAFAARRCLVIADGYYEWKTTSDGKQAYLIENREQSVFAFAGLWEANANASPDGNVIRTCTILTTSGNDFTREIHDRMPVIIADHDQTRWLDPGYHDTEKLQSLLVAMPNDSLQMTPVAKHVGNVRNHDKQCAEPIGESLTWA